MTVDLLASYADRADAPPEVRRRVTEILGGLGGTYGNVLGFLPPLPISNELLNEGLDIVGDALS